MSVKTAATAAMQTTLVAIVISTALASAALASAARTFVSSTGNDANNASNCPLGSPCRSFAAAYAVTSSGGEIVALDSAGYGELTITGPVSIIGALVASVTVTANSTGITINAGPSDNIILRNLQINGGNAVNSVGIAVNSNAGHLTLQNSTLKLLSTGLSVTNAKADVQNCDIVANGTGIATSGTGFDTQNGSNGPNTGVTEVRISGGNITGNVTGWTMSNPGLDANNSPVNKTTIMLNAQGGGAAQPNIVGNGAYFAVTGTGGTCSTFNGNQNVCVGFGSYNYNQGFQFQ